MPHAELLLLLDLSILLLLLLMFLVVSGDGAIDSERILSKDVYGEGFEAFGGEGLGDFIELFTGDRDGDGFAGLAAINALLGGTSR